MGKIQGGLWTRIVASFMQSGREAETFGVEEARWRE